MVCTSPNFRKNQLLTALSNADLALLQPDLEPVELEVRKVLESSNKPNCVRRPKPLISAPPRKISGVLYARETRAEADTAKVLTMDEARRVANNIAKLPLLLSKRP